MVLPLEDLLKAAKDHLKELSTLPNPDFRLEQAEYNEDEKCWEIVVSYLVENTNRRGAGAFVALVSEFEFHRMYKRIKFNEDNEIVGFYIFENK